MKIRRQLIGVAAGLFLFAGTASAASYTVAPGDTLWKLSTQYKTTVAELMASNGLTSSTINVGQILRVPGYTPYTLAKGDTLWLVSQKFGITLDALIKANPAVTNANNITVGTVIQVPDPVISAVAKPAQLADGIFPLPKGTYSPLANNYNDGRSWSPTGDTARTHEGVDILAPEGTPIYSSMAGEIVNFGWNEYGGWRVTVRVDSSTVLYYAHLSKYAQGIGKGSKLAKGQLIGYVGDTGYGPVGTKGQFVPHLHFGVYKTDKSAWYTVDPFPYLQWWESKL